jgi:hypothetical protein
MSATPTLSRIMMITFNSSPKTRTFARLWAPVKA